MEKRRILLVVIILIMLGAGMYDVFKLYTGSVEKTIINGSGDLIGKTYEQGLWDGHNLTIQMLKHKGLFNDTIRLRITEVDSVLHNR